MQNTSSYDSPVELEDDRWQDIDFTPYEGFASFISTPVFSTLLNVKNSVVFLVTGNRFGKCLTKDALVDTSNGKIPIYELYKANRPFMVWSWDGKNKVLAKADAPFKKDGTHDCYRITMSDNRVIEAADHHQILMQNGHYASVRDIYDYIHGSNSSSLQPRLLMCESLSVPLCVEGNSITTIEPIPCQQECYDFSVDKYHNYFSGGLVHHNTKYFARKIIFSLMGISPIAWHNITPDTKHRVIRLAAETLPQDRNNEVRNTIYPAIKNQLPSTMIARTGNGEFDDITLRDATITVNPLLGGGPAYLEFVSYGQTTKSQAGVDRFLIDIDEVCSYEFYEESIPRLAITNGQLLIGCTPVDADWMYSEIYEKAKLYVRTPAVRRYMKKEFGASVPSVEKMGSTKDICVIQAASDDNPIFAKLVEDKKKEIKLGRISKDDFPYDNVEEYLDHIYLYDDKDAVAMRRFGIFRRVTGAMYKQFQWNVHIIEGGKYFPTGIPVEWLHARAVDYHQAVPWAIVWAALSRDNECFVYFELNPDPKQWTTLSVCKEMVEASKEYRFPINLIDPLANETQSNTNKTVMDDFNTHFREMKRSGLGTGGYWEPWDTKGKVGQDRIRERLINSLICGRPFNNLQKREGRETRLPTLWVLNNCVQTASSLKNWRQETWASKDHEMTKDAKDKPEQKWSHFNKCLESIMKDIRFRGQPHEYQTSRVSDIKNYSFKGRKF